MSMAAEMRALAEKHIDLGPTDLVALYAKTYPKRKFNKSSAMQSAASARSALGLTRTNTKRKQDSNEVIKQIKAAKEFIEACGGKGNALGALEVLSDYSQKDIESGLNKWDVLIKQFGSEKAANTALDNMQAVGLI